MIDVRVQRVREADVTWHDRLRPLIPNLRCERGEHRRAIVSMQGDLLINKRRRGTKEPAPFIPERHQVNLARDVVSHPSDGVGLDKRHRHRIVIRGARHAPGPGFRHDIGDGQLVGFTIGEKALVPADDRRPGHDGERVRVHALVQRVEVAICLETGELACGVGGRG